MVLQSRLDLAEWMSSLYTSRKESLMWREKGSWAVNFGV